MALDMRAHARARARARAHVCSHVERHVMELCQHPSKSCRPKPFPEPLMLLTLAPRVRKEKRSLDDAHPGPQQQTTARASNVQLLAGADDPAHEHLHGVCERENCTCTLPQCGHDFHGVSEHEHLHGVCERENCTCTLPQCGHAPPRCF